MCDVCVCVNLCMYVCTYVCVVPVLGLMTLDPKYVLTVLVMPTALPHLSTTLR